MSRKKITFYNRNGKFRTGELRDLSHNAAQFTVLTVRRQVRHTSLKARSSSMQAQESVFFARLMPSSAKTVTAAAWSVDV